MLWGSGPHCLPNLQMFSVAVLHWVSFYVQFAAFQILLWCVAHISHCQTLLMSAHWCTLSAKMSIQFCYTFTAGSVAKQQFYPLSHSNLLYRILGWNNVPTFLPWTGCEKWLMFTYPINVGTGVMARLKDSTLPSHFLVLICGLHFALWQIVATSQLSAKTYTKRA